MTLLILISISISLLYVLGTCLVVKGIPYSISDSFYKLEEKKKNLGYSFTLFCWGIAFTLLPAMLEKTIDTHQWLAFIACGGMALIGAAPFFKNEDSSLHIAGCIVSIIFSQLWAFQQIWYIPLICWILYIAGTALYMANFGHGKFLQNYISSRPVFWIEITAFISVYTTLIFS